MEKSYFLKFCILTPSKVPFIYDKFHCLFVLYNVYNIFFTICLTINISFHFFVDKVWGFTTQPPNSFSKSAKHNSSTHTPLVCVGLLSEQPEPSLPCTHSNKHAERNKYVTAQRFEDHRSCVSVRGLGLAPLGTVRGLGASK